MNQKIRKRNSFLIDNAPYISFVGFARNDDYIPNRAELHNFSLNFLIRQLKDLRIPSEIILVEWNYSDDLPPLAETIKIEVESTWTTLRVIRVPSKYHERYKHWKLKPFHVGAAANVGFRRAKGKFILPMASDVFLSDDCLKKIASKELDIHSFYRCDRYDIDSGVLEDFIGNRNDFFTKCSKNIKAHHSYIHQESSFQIADLHTNASGDFCLVSRDLLCQIRGLKEGKDVGGFDIDSLILHALNGLGSKQTLLPDDCRVYKLFHEKSTARSVEQVYKGWQKNLERIIHRLTKSNKAVNDVRVLFNYPKRRYSYAPGAIFDSFEKNFVRPARQWAKKIPPFHLNGENWGLGEEELEEHKVL